MGIIFYKLSPIRREVIIKGLGMFLKVFFILISASALAQDSEVECSNIKVPQQNRAECLKSPLSIDEKKLCLKLDKQFIGKCLTSLVSFEQKKACLVVGNKLKAAKTIIDKCLTSPNYADSAGLCFNKLSKYNYEVSEKVTPVKYRENYLAGKYSEPGPAYYQDSSGDLYTKDNYYINHRESLDTVAIDSEYRFKVTENFITLTSGLVFGAKNQWTGKKNEWAKSYNEFLQLCTSTNKQVVDRCFTNFDNNQDGSLHEVEKCLQLHVKNDDFNKCNKLLPKALPDRGNKMLNCINQFKILEATKSVSSKVDAILNPAEAEVEKTVNIENRNNPKDVILQIKEKENSSQSKQH